MNKAKHIIVNFSLLFSLILTSCGSFHQSKTSREALEIVIQQINLVEMDTGLTYIIRSRRIEVWTDEGMVYSSDITEDELLELEKHRKVLEGLKMYYDANMIDGFVWKVVLRDQNTLNFVYLNNVGLPSTNRLFEQINRLLPEKLEKIYLLEPLEP
ncbi:hypothetical protein [Croceimicrobium hydrocarbonivorans]|uniref:Uncharacterized protein n=1 Tax=Croceimicrobium hydrocarbonivorans TaxID=2761580 RepID=A0A7H0VIV6_9FLAO|nr:hypothetical protein [Croceimicrobium hydrocarbonivorans]QNR25654.1 hypothetical protein H4K34_07385 [Croceimicrobium hydrocarbonivorans]